jgi:hypothetical protein
MVTTGFTTLKKNTFANQSSKEIYLSEFVICSGHTGRLSTHEIRAIQLSPVAIYSMDAAQKLQNSLL